MNKKLVVFNWKMAPSSLKKAEDLFSSAKKFKNKNAELVISPPFEYLEPLLKHSKNKTIKAGAQDVFYKEKGAYTGEISPKMLKNLGVEYVIIGHSERRKFLNETDEMINKKVLAALKAGLKVILCVGEPKRELEIKNYELMLKKAKDFVKKQLERDLKNIPNSLFIIHNSLIIAYEPIWAIGTGHNDTPKDAVEMSKFIKSLVMSRLSFIPKVLYGGSVDSKNIQKFLQYKEIDGALVGHASVDKRKLNKIFKIINKK